MVGGHHVVVGVMRKMRAQSIARLARIAVTDAVREDDEITSGIEQLTRSKEHAGKLRRKELRACAARAMQDQNGIAHRAVAVAYGFADGPIVKLQFRQGLTAAEVE